MKAIYNGVVLAESNSTIEVEGNQYFPPGAVDMKYLQKTKTTSHCPWKGRATYYTIEVDDQKNIDAAWSYQQPKEAANQIAGYIAFWKGVEVQE